jgi:hypothetical protein
MTNCIPNRRRKLPFVYNVGAIAYEHEFWVGTSHVQLFIHIADALRVGQSRPRLSAPLRTSHLYGPEDLEIALYLLVHKTRQISILYKRFPRHGPRNLFSTSGFFASTLYYQTIHGFPSF